MPELKHANINHINEILADPHKKYSLLSTAFAWADTPQGHEHWVIRSAGATPLHEGDLLYLRKIRIQLLLGEIEESFNRRCQYLAPKTSPLKAPVKVVVRQIPAWADVAATRRDEFRRALRLLQSMSGH